MVDVRDETQATLALPAARLRDLGGATRASVVADAIIEDLASAGWPVGDVVGSEADLLERHQVGRSVLREAIRLLEHLHIATMRRGPGGGLVVLAPSAASITDAVAVWLAHEHVVLAEVFDARAILETTAAVLATERLDEAGTAALRSIVDAEAAGPVDHRDLHNLLARLTGNPILELFVDLLHQVSLFYLPVGTRFGAATLSASADAHRAIVDSMLAGDVGRVRGRMRVHIEAEAALLDARGPSVDRFFRTRPVAEAAPKLGEQVATTVLRRIVDTGWPTGSTIGSVPELMADHDVSRSVVREAVRLLELLQVARMRRGPGGGLVVLAPGVDAVVDAVALNLDRMNVTAADLGEVRSIIELAVLDRVIDQGPAAHAALLAAAEREGAGTEPVGDRGGDDLHVVLAGLSGNRVLQLLVAVLVRLTWRRIPPTEALVGAPHLGEAHNDIVAAIVAGDRTVARLRLRDHLDLVHRERIG